jgi:hypothetical protein
MSQPLRSINKAEVLSLGILLQNIRHYRCPQSRMGQAALYRFVYRMSRVEVNEYLLACAKRAISWRLFALIVWL